MKVNCKQDQLIPYVINFGLGRIKKTSLFYKFAVHSKIPFLSKLFMNVKVSYIK